MAARVRSAYAMYKFMPCTYDPCKTANTHVWARTSASLLGGSATSNGTASRSLLWNVHACPHVEPQSTYN